MRPYIVGEDGPEVFWPSSAGHVVPELGAGSSSAGRDDDWRLPASKRIVIQNLTINESGDPQRTLRAVKQALTDNLARA
jgi:hypothetical protein